MCRGLYFDRGCIFTVYIKGGLFSLANVVTPRPAMEDAQVVQLLISHIVQKMRSTLNLEDACIIFVLFHNFDMIYISLFSYLSFPILDYLRNNIKGWVMMDIESVWLTLAMVMSIKVFSKTFSMIETDSNNMMNCQK